MYDYEQKVCIASLLYHIYIYIYIYMVDMRSLAALCGPFHN